MKKAVICFLMVTLAGMNSCAGAAQPSSQNRSATPSAAQASQPSTAPAQRQAAQPTAQPQPVQLAQAGQPKAQPQAAASKPKVAVYVTGGKNASENKALAARMTHGLVNSGRYSAIERTDAFLDQVAKEMVTQRSGAIDDKQTNRLAN